MHLIGRWEKVRTLGPRGWGLPYLLDTKWRRLLPYQREEWWRSPSGLWIPMMRGGSYAYGQYVPLVIGSDFEAGMSLNTEALDSNYAAGVGGEAAGFRFVPPDALTISKVGFFIGLFTGTAANVNDIEMEVRPEDAANPRPDTATLTGSAVLDPGGTTGWKFYTGLSIALTAGSVYWLIIGDADGNTTDRAFIATRNNLLSAKTFAMQLRSAFTASGFTTNPTVSLAMSAGILLVFSDGTVMGYPFTARAVSLTNALERGYHYTTGWPFNAKVYGALSADESSGFDGIRVWLGTDGPAGTPYADSSAYLPEQGTNRTGAIFTRPFPVVGRGTPFRLTFVYGANVGVPARWQCGAGADADVKKAMIGGGEWIFTHDVAGTWTDNDAEQPAMNVLVDDVFTEGTPLALSVSDGLR